MPQSYSVEARLQMKVEGAAQAKKELQDTGAAFQQLGQEAEAAAKKSGGFSLAGTLADRRAAIQAGGGIPAGRATGGVDAGALRGDLGFGPVRRGGNGDNSRFENVDTGFSAVQILAGGLGQRDLSESAGLVADVANFIDTIPQLKQGIQDVAGVFQSSTGVIGKLAGAGSALLSPLGATAAGLGAITAVILPLAAALAVAVAATKYYQAATEDGSKRLQAASDQLTAYYGALESGTKESLAKEVEALKVKKQLADEELKIRVGAAQKAFESEQKGFGGDAAARLKFALAGLDPGFKSNAERVDALKKSSVDLDSQIVALDRAMGSATVAARNAAEEQKALAAASAQYGKDRVAQEIQIQQAIKEGSIDSVKGRLESIEIEKNVLEKELKGRKTTLDHLAAAGQPTEEAAKKVKELQERIDALKTEAERYTPEVLKQIQATHDLKEAAAASKQELDGAKTALKDVSKQIADTETDRAKQLGRRAEDDRIAAERETITSGYQARIKAAQEADQLKQHNDRVGAITKGGQDKIADLRNQAAKAEQQQIAESGKARTALDKNFMAESLAAVKAYQTQEQQADSQHKTARLRLLQDMYDSLYNATAENDVAAFLAAKRAGEKGISRLDEDNEAAAKARQDAFLEQEQARDQKYADDTAALQNNLEEQKQIRDQGLQEQIAQIAAQTEESLKAEQEQWQRRVTLAQTLQDELSALQEQWRKDDQTRTRQLEQQDYDERLKLLKDSQTEQINILGRSFDGQLEIVKAFGQNAVAALRGDLGAAVNAANILQTVLTGAGIGDLIGGIGNIFGFADGGIVTKPTIGLLGEKPGWGDRVTPFPLAQGPNAAGGPPSIVVDQRGALLSGGATQADLDRIKFETMQAAVTAWEMASAGIGVD